jgi:hypothetical protein
LGTKSDLTGAEHPAAPINMPIVAQPTSLRFIQCLAFS